MRNVITAFLLLVPLLTLLAPTAHATTNTIVNISGQVSIDGVTVTVRAHASGTPSALSGAGTDTPDSLSKFAGNPLVCHWPVTGSVSAGVVTLAGIATQSSVRAEIGTPITLTADASTGSITWTFDGLTLTGTGTVDIRNA